jgi:peroxiredoxin
MRSLHLSISAVLLGSLLLTAPGIANQEQATPVAAPQSILPTYEAVLDRPAPHFTLQDTAGKVWKLADLRGQTVILEWFNPDCPVVRAAHKKGAVLESLGNRIGAKEKVTWLAINSGSVGMQGHGLERNVAGRTELGVEYPVLLDESGAVGRSYNARTTPQMYIIDANGILISIGGHDDGKGGDFISKAVAAALKGKKPNPQKTRNYGCSVKYPKVATLGAVAPQFELKSMSGENFALRNTLGKVVVLEWFNPECPVVKAAHETGPLQKAAADTTASGQVIWAAINSADGVHTSAQKTVNETAASLWGMKHAILKDPTGATGRNYQAKVTPFMVVLDQRGVIVYQGSPGDMEKPMVQTFVKQLLTGQPVRPLQTKAEGCSIKYSKKAAAGERSGKRGKRGERGRRTRE